MNTYRTRNIGLTIFLMMNSQTVINSKILDNYNIEIETEFKIKSELPILIESYLSGNAMIDSKEYNKEIVNIIQYLIHSEEYPFDEIDL